MQRHYQKRIVQLIAVLGALALAISPNLSFAGTTTYKYDALGRVVEVDYPDGSIVTYTYDKNGNRTATTRHAGP